MSLRTIGLRGSFVACVAGMIGCGAPSLGGGSDSVDASTAVEAGTSRVHVQSGPSADDVAIVAARGEPWIGGALANKSHGLRLDQDRYRSQGRFDKGAVAGDIDVAAHVDASVGVKIGVGKTIRFTTNFRPVGANAATAEEDHGRLAYRDVWPGTDLVVATGARFVELAVVLKDASAPTSFAWQTELPSGIAKATLTATGTLLFEDVRGRGIYFVHAPVAIDSNGRKVPGKLAWDGRTMTVTFDRAGLTYPIVLDPTTEILTWTETVTDGPTLAYDARLLFFNGSMTKVGGRGANPTTDSTIQIYERHALPFAYFYWSQASGALGTNPLGGVSAESAAVSYNSTDNILEEAAGWNGTANTAQYARYDATAGTWTGPVALSSAPPFAARSGAPFATTFVLGGSFKSHTSFTDQVGFLIGGANGGTTYNELWWLLNDSTWHQYTYPAGLVEGTGYPQRRSDAVLIGTNSQGGYLISGHDPNSGGGTDYADLWALGGSGGATSGSETFTWTPFCGTSSTASCGTEFVGRGEATGTYDSARGVLVWGTGMDKSGADHGDLWEYDINASTWTAVCGTPSTTPCAGATTTFAPRHGAAMAFNPNDTSVMIIGGYNNASSTYLTETWVYTVLGGACTLGSECDSGFCVDGVCCSSNECATCQSCALAGTIGQCTNVPEGQTDPDSCPVATNSCDGNGACKSDVGQVCKTATDCANGQCVPSSSGASVCCSSAACATGQICQVGTGSCIGDIGYACSGNAQCNSGYCVDGVCCSTACDPTQQCQQCNAAGHVGQCVPVANGSQPSTATGRKACPAPTTGDASCNTASCNGSDIAACHYPSSTTACTGKSKCSGTIEIDASGCNGAGDCTYGTSKSCGVFACEAGACASSCKASTDCAAGFFCNGTGSCVALEGAGASCTATTDCKATLTCVDGVCCTASTCAPTGTCNGTHPGACTLNDGVAATTASQCTSNELSDGVCCNAPCTGQCESCSVAGSVGTCVPTPNGSAPAGSRAKCATASSDPVCGAETCNGANRTACAVTVAGTSCGANACASGTATTVGKCDGISACTGQQSIACAPYTCGATACKTTCTKATETTDCQSGYYCDGTNHCTVKLATGSTCSAGAGDACSSGSCVNGVCCSTASCAAGAICNDPAHMGTCVLPLGQACTATGTPCASGNCVDGYCCNSACAGQCEACDGGGGICAAVTGAPHGGRAACVASGTDPTCGVTKCDGLTTASCTATALGTSCGADTCTSGLASTIGKCDGVSACTGIQSTQCAPYACGATACKTTCTTTTDCTSGNYCNIPTGASSGHCVAKLNVGTTCTTGAQCSNGNCVNGVCCGSATCPTGAVCNDPSFLGTCSLPLGQKCQSGTPCSSNFCADGYCCNAACGGQCEACDVTGLAGTCSPVPTKTQPHGSRAACAKTGTDATCSQSYCDGVQRKQCAYPDADTSCGSASCVAGVFESAGVCSGGGVCTPTSSNGCVPYQCGTNACLTSCTADTQCSPGAYCDGTGHCAYKANAGAPCATDAACGSGLYCVDNICCGSASCPGGLCVNQGSEKGVCKSSNGQTCTSADECVSGNCVDGFCCNTSCTDQCAACNVPSLEGVCAPTIGAPVGGRPPCSGDGTTCGTQACLGGTTTCAYPLGSTPCGGTTCDSSSNTELDPGYCDATTHTCDATKRECGYFVCGAAGCGTSCKSDADCVTNAFCASDGSCQLKGALGQPCDGKLATSCGTDASGNALGCQDGVCCNDPLCDTHGGYCGGSHPGSCLAVNDSGCSADTDCSSGHCADIGPTGKGVCCDTACTGICETCSSSSTPGTCAAVRGAPAAGHGTCPAGTGDVCSGNVCDGTARTSCAGKPGPETVCLPAACASGQFNPDITCDGSGSCPSSTQSYCPNFRVCANASTCAQGACTGDADCVDGYTCVTATGTCTPKVAHCDPNDPTVSVAPDGSQSSCVPFLCNSDGTCKTTCATTSDCSGGNVCDTGSQVCVAVNASAPQSSGGCSLNPSTARDAAFTPWILAAMVGVSMQRRRRRAT